MRAVRLPGGEEMFGRQRQPRRRCAAVGDPHDSPRTVPRLDAGVQRGGDRSYCEYPEGATLQGEAQKLRALAFDGKVLRAALRQFLKRHFGGSGLVEPAVLAVLSQCPRM